MIIRRVSYTKYVFSKLKHWSAAAAVQLNGLWRMHKWINEVARDPVTSTARLYRTALFISTYNTIIRKLAFVRVCVDDKVIQFLQKKKWKLSRLSCLS